MKKIISLAILAVMAFTASAQLHIGGTVNAWRNGSEHETTLTIMPEVGYTISDNLIIGTEIGWNHFHKKGLNNNLFGIAPYARYTFLQSGIVGLFVEGGFDVFAGKTSFENGGESDTATTFGIGFKPGASFKVSEKVTLVTKFGFLGYEGANDAAKAAGYVEGWGLRFTGNNIEIGFFYTL
ncbi:MAG: porin family protein [Duncaniella sp.]|nr:porin family protein [Duncaniella sp.]